MKNEYLLPGAVVLGAGLIGAGLFFGLRARPVEPPPPPAASAPAPPATPSAPPVVLAPPPGIPGVGLTPPAVPAEVQARAEEAAQKALLQYKKDTLVPACWAPAVKARPEPPKAQYKISIAFGPDGKEAGRGWHELREASREDVASCLQKQPMGLSIPPPGVPVSLLLPVDFP